MLGSGSRVQACHRWIRRDVEVAVAAFGEVGEAFDGCSDGLEGATAIAPVDDDFGPDAGCLHVDTAEGDDLPEPGADRGAGGPADRLVADQDVVGVSYEPPLRGVGEVDRPANARPLAS